MRMFELPPGWQADQNHHRLTRRYAVQNISLYLSLSSQDEEIFRLVRENNIAFAKEARKIAKKIREEEPSKPVHYEIAHGLLYDKESTNSKEDVQLSCGGILHLKTTHRWGISCGLLLLRLAQMANTENLCEKHISLNRAIEVFISDINKLHHERSSNYQHKQTASESHHEHKKALHNYPFGNKYIYLPASRKSLMRAWAYCRPAAHLWAAYVITLLGKKRPSSADLNRFVGYSRWFEHFCTTFQPLRSRSVLIASDAMWHVPETLGKMRSPTLLELDRVRATIVRQYSLLNDIDEKAAWDD